MEASRFTQFTRPDQQTQKRLAAETRDGTSAPWLWLRGPYWS
ncbi:hypothetical protein TRICHSKD4_4034 [Roseibium sp. TrichSKD4]|nr:hypothetical protein TRICHSKD4_4034 [Roseibium sp. TrichSKD4]